MPFGELSAVGAAFAWALEGLILRPITRELVALRITALQSVVVCIAFWSVSFSTGRIDDVFALPLGHVLALGFTSLFGHAAGDTSYVHSLRHLGLARAFTVSTAGFVVIALAVGALALGEPVTYRQWAGAAVILAGIWLVSQVTEVSISGGRGQALPAAHLAPPLIRQGLVFAGLAAVCWGLNTVALRVLLVGMDVLVASTVRLTVAALALNLAAFSRFGWRTVIYPKRTAGLLALAGLIGLGMGSLFILNAIQIAGAGKAAVLSSTSPLFAAVLAVVFLKERVTAKLVIGTLLTVIGMVMVAL